MHLQSYLCIFTWRLCQSQQGKQVRQHSTFQRFACIYLYISANKNKKTKKLFTINVSWTLNNIFFLHPFWRKLVWSLALSLSFYMVSPAFKATSVPLLQGWGRGRKEQPNSRVSGASRGSMWEAEEQWCVIDAATLPFLWTLCKMSRRGILSPLFCSLHTTEMSPCSDFNNPSAACQTFVPAVGQESVGWWVVEGLWKVKGS